MKLFRILFLFLSLDVASASAVENLAFQSVEETKTYYQELIRQHKSGVKLSLQDFNRTFAPIEKALLPNDENFYACTHGTKPSNLCDPDTLYSWGPAAKLKNIDEATKINIAPWPRGLNGQRPLFLTASAVGTYCYGRFPIRLKIKKGHHLDGLPWDVILQWTIYPGEEAVIDSISFGQAAHFDEMVIEIQRRLDQEAVWHTTRTFIAIHPEMKKYFTTGISKIISFCADENLPLTEQTLVENLIQFLEAILSDRGWIHFQKNANGTSEDHFRTDWPSFFNPN